VAISCIILGSCNTVAVTCCITTFFSCCLNTLTLHHVSVVRPKPPVQFVSIISAIFDGKILSAVQCLTCERVTLLINNNFSSYFIAFFSGATLFRQRKPPEACCSRSFIIWISFLLSKDIDQCLPWGRH